MIEVYNFSNTVKTRADVIRDMSDEKLALYLSNILSTPNGSHMGYAKLLDWLKVELRPTEDYDFYPSVDKTKNISKDIK